MADDIADLAKLPVQISLLAREVPRAGLALNTSSLGRWLDPIPRRAIVSLNEVRMGWRLYIARSDSRVVFFFFRQKSPVSVVLDTNIAFRVTTVSRTQPPTLIQADEINRRIVRPSFIKANPLQSELDTFGPPGCKPENSIFLLLGNKEQNILVVKQPENINKARLRYSPNGGPGTVIDPHNGKWSLLPFLDLTETIRSWVQQGFDLGIAASFDEKQLGEKSSHVRQILSNIIKAYTEAANQVHATQPAPIPLSSLSRVEYDVLNFEARVLLRLKDDGSLASDNSDDPFQLLLSVRLLPALTGVDARIAIGPPDFLVSGDLHKAFLETLQAQDALAEIAARLGISTAETGTFLRTFAELGSIFRIKRGDTADTDILVLPGIISGEVVPVLLSGRFVVQAAKEPPQVTLVPGSIRNLLSAEGNISLVDAEAVKYFLRLLTNIKRWIGVLQ